MSELKRVGEIEVNQDLDFQRAEWRFQRLAWVALALVAVASILGVFGGGPVAQTSSSSPGGELRVEHERIARRNAVTRFVLNFPRAKGEIGISLPSDYLKISELRSVMPQPSRTESGAGSSTLYFNLQPGAVVTFVFERHVTGLQTLDLGLNGRSALRLKQFVLP